MAIIYFVDSENVGDRWIDLLEEPDSQFFVFYTGKSPRIAYSQVIQLMNATNKPKFFECYEGNNGLDFQLVSYLGYELHADNTNEMVIVSNDTGFDAVVHFWVARGMKVRRCSLSNTSNTQILEVKQPVSDDECITDSLSVEVTGNINGIDKRELYTIINCIGVNETSYIHLALVHFYGNKSGENIYKSLKKENFVAPSVQWTKETRMKKFIELIIKYVNTSEVSIPDSLPGFIINNIVGDKKTMGNKINKSYGGCGPQLNKMFKPFYKTLATIKKK